MVSCVAGVGGCVGLFVVARSMIGILLYSIYLEHVSLCVERLCLVKCSIVHGVNTDTIRSS